MKHKCDLCDKYIRDKDQEATIPFDVRDILVHKSCAMQLWLGAYDELSYRSGNNIPLNAPYTDAHIYDAEHDKWTTTRDAPLYASDLIGARYLHKAESNQEAKVAANQVILKALLFDKEHEN